MGKSRNPRHLHAGISIDLEQLPALLLGDGHAPRQIANTVGVTDNTVRSQIKSVFSKTGVKRQGELIRLLLSHSGPTIQGTQSV